MAYSDTLNLWATATHNEINFVQWRPSDCDLFDRKIRRSILPESTIARAHVSRESDGPYSRQESIGVVRGGTTSGSYVSGLDKKIQQRRPLGGIISSSPRRVSNVPRPPLLSTIALILPLELLMERPRMY